MNFLRKLAVSFCAGILSLVLLGAAWTSVVSGTVRNRNTVKSWFSKSGFYDQIVNVALEKINFHQDSGSTEQIPLDNQQIKDTAKTVLTPAFLQKNVEAFLDGIYNWLDGSSTTINFDLDLNGIKQSLADNLGNYLKTRVDGLPVCAAGQGSQDFNGFNDTCRPANTSGADVAKKLTDDITSGDFLKNARITGADIKIKQPDGSSITLDQSSQGKVVKQAYQYSGYAPALLGLLAVVMALGVVFLSSDHLKGLKRVGTVTLTAGILLLLAVVTTHVGLGWLKNELAKQDSFTASQLKLATNFANQIFGSINKVLEVFTGIYVIGGVGVIVGSHILRKKRGGKEEPKTEELETTEKKDTEETKPVEDKKPEEEQGSEDK